MEREDERRALVHRRHLQPVHRSGRPPGHARPDGARDGRDRERRVARSPSRGHVVVYRRRPKTRCIAARVRNSPPGHARNRHLRVRPPLERTIVPGRGQDGDGAMALGQAEPRLVHGLCAGERAGGGRDGVARRRRGGIVLRRAGCGRNTAGVVYVAKEITRSCRHRRNVVILTEPPVPCPLPSTPSRTPLSLPRSASKTTPSLSASFLVVQQKKKCARSWQRRSASLTSQNRTGRPSACQTKRRPGWNP